MLSVLLAAMHIIFASSLSRTKPFSQQNEARVWASTLLMLRRAERLYLC